MIRLLPGQTLRAAVEAVKRAFLKSAAIRPDEIGVLDEAAAGAAALIVSELSHSIDAHDLRLVSRHKRRAWGAAKIKLKAGLPALAAAIAEECAAVFADEKAKTTQDSKMFADDVADAFS